MAKNFRLSPTREFEEIKTFSNLKIKFLNFCTRTYFEFSNCDISEEKFACNYFLILFLLVSLFFPI